MAISPKQSFLYLCFGLFSGIILLSLLLGFWNRFPSREKVNYSLGIYKSEPIKEERIRILRNLLRNVSDPSNSQEDKLVGDLADKLVKLYRSNADDAILEAVDSTKIDGGFANYLCGFYSELLQDKRFLQRYNSNPKARFAIERCVGITIGCEEYEKVFKHMSR